MAGQEAGRSPTGVFRTRIQLRWGDCDQLGHINNVAYMEYAQEARLRFLTQVAGSGSGIGAVVVRRIEVDFDRSLQYDVDGIDVEIDVAKVGRSSFTLRHRLLDSAGRLCSTIEAVVVAVDLQSETSRPLPDDVRALLAAEIRDA